MAIIACPYCGKRISDRMEKCPHCSATLTKQELPEVAVKQHTNNPFLNRVLNIILSIIFVICLISIWNFWSTISIGRMIGAEGLAAFTYASNLFFMKVFPLLCVISGVLFFTLYTVLQQKPTVQFIISIITTLLLGLLGFILQNNAVTSEAVPSSIVDLTKSLSLAYGFTFPVVLGSLCIVCYGRALQKSLIMQLLGTVIFFLAVILLDIILVNMFLKGLQGFSIGNLTSAIFVLAFAILTSKEFQKLLAGSINLK